MKHCNQCLYVKHGAQWRKRCVFQDTDGNFRTYLDCSPPGQKWGIGCLLCASYLKHCPEKVGGKITPFMNHTKGQTGKLQLEDLLRHGNLSKSSYVCKQHQEAVAWWLGKDLRQASELSDAPASSPTAPISSAQCLTAIEVVWSPLAAQGSEYEKRCLSLNRRQIGFESPCLRLSVHALCSTQRLCSPQAGSIECSCCPQ